MASFELSFRARTAASLVALTSMTLVAASSFVAGCSSSSDSSTPDAAVQVCPDTIASALATPACTGNPDGKPCIVGFICPNELNEVATCNCTNNAWACVDHDNAPITDPEAGTNCTALANPQDSQCPANESAANNASCKTPGLICSYAGATCTGASSPNTDTCQCVNGGDAGLIYDCEQPACIAPPTDAGTFSTDAGDH